MAWRLPLVAMLLIGAASCATPIPAPRPGYALCTPCAEAGDLGCIEVKMTPEAVQLQLDGQTAWCCREECRDPFLEDRRAAGRR